MNPAELYLMTLSERSRETMISSLRQISSFLGEGHQWEKIAWADLRHEQIIMLRSWLDANYSPASGNKMLSCLRGVLKQAWRLEELSTDEYMRLTDIQGIRGDSPKKGRMLAEWEIKKLLGMCESGLLIDLRNTTLIKLGLLGLRMEEMRQLNIGDLGIREERIRVRGKGKKIRNVPIPEGWDFRDWLERIGGLEGEVDYDGKAPFVGPVRRLKKRLTRSGMQMVFRNIRENSGINFTSHDLRRTFISKALGRGIDLATVQMLAGHSSPRTTTLYDRRPERVKKEAMDKIWG